MSPALDEPLELGPRRRRLLLRETGSVCTRTLRFDDIQGSTSSSVKLAAEHLTRSEAPPTCAEVESLRADLQLMRTQVGSAIGVARAPLTLAF